GTEVLEHLVGGVGAEVRHQQRLLDLVPGVLVHAGAAGEEGEDAAAQGAGAGEPLAQAHHAVARRLGGLDRRGRARAGLCGLGARRLLRRGGGLLDGRLRRLGRRGLLDRLLRRRGLLGRRRLLDDTDLRGRLLVEGGLGGGGFGGGGLGGGSTVRGSVLGGGPVRCGRGRSGGLRVRGSRRLRRCRGGE